MSMTELCVHVDWVDNDVVVRTLPGAARAVAQCVDDAHWEGALGTIAGNDSVIIICDTPERAQALAGDFPVFVHATPQQMTFVHPSTT